MPFSLLAQFEGRLDWRALRDAAVPGLVAVELFPVPAVVPSEGDALGICIPSKHAPAPAWAELEALFERLRPFSLTVIDLQSGLTVSPQTLPKIRANFLA